MKHGKTFVWAKQTILCTGAPAGCIANDESSIATADGHAVAFRAGAELRDMELMQFHPTVLYIAGAHGTSHRGRAREGGIWSTPTGIDHGRLRFALGAGAGATSFPSHHQPDG